VPWRWQSGVILLNTLRVVRLPQATGASGHSGAIMTDPQPRKDDVESSSKTGQPAKKASKPPKPRKVEKRQKGRKG
jgi:hypothetical protein